MNHFSLQPLTPAYDAPLATLIRRLLAAHGLDIPGTVYFDKDLDHLSDYYDKPGCAYFVLLDDTRLIGGIGLAPFAGFPACCELQKLYLDESVQGAGLSYKLIETIEETARKLGYQYIYLETHHNLTTAMHVYEKCGYREIPRPQSVVHSTMNHFFLKNL